jgi:hypothetical protein
MPTPLKTALPPAMGLSAGYVVRFNAIDPTTGADVAGVTFTDAVLHVRTLTENALEQLESGPFLLVPGPGA